MPFSRYHRPQFFAPVAEFGMGYQVVCNRNDPSTAEIYILFNHEFMLPISEIFRIDPLLTGVPPEDWERTLRSNAIVYSADLIPCDTNMFIRHRLLMDMTSGPGGQPPSASPPDTTDSTVTPTPYGHLPFRKVTATDHERFVRFTLFPTDRRVDPDTGEVLPGTFAAPASEERVVHGGFAAVGRFALPSLHPAVWRRDIIPPANTPYMAGAVVPMFGQAGGGAEVMQQLSPGSAHRKPARIGEF